MAGRLSFELEGIRRQRGGSLDPERKSVMGSRAASRRITIKLTDEEREQIHRKTGEEISELTIGTIEPCNLRAHDEEDRQDGLEEPQVNLRDEFV